ncbi:alternate-type signal peptide domain-containing protein [Nocardioides antri]|uniref:Alternate-type signal peptide domain-containing protein n=1 Tax=Nocardioides antri TaxID=2607659 RepID=A0A5B1LU11_9ACTN|nr:alternate-type signal peptide domain-containing protein [Nocardioides antri]KAA1424121.1 alternate-type signal peptide domain-containing protein [Nocardioides antri]
MKKSTKGAVAAGGAAVLLMGGAGTLAFWTATGDADGGAITAGSMTLTPVGCDANWVYATGSAGAGTTVTTFVPGDVVTKECTFTIGATGDNLSATVDAPDTLTFTTAPAATSFSATVDATYDVDGTAIADGGTVTDADDGETLTVAFEVDIPFGTADPTGINDNDMQGVVATLDTLTVTLTQVDPNP